MSDESPILYSFRRCPYAMRARMTLRVSGVQTQLREVVLRDKPAALLQVSAKGTVPVLVLEDRVIDESIDIMLWALQQNDPAGWLAPDEGDLGTMLALVNDNDGDFKHHLDRYKYADRYEGDVDPLEHRVSAGRFLAALEQRLTRPFLFGERRSLADIAIAPFVRQFSNVDASWWATSPYPGVQAWLGGILADPVFTSTMYKFPQWHSGDAIVLFPSEDTLG